MTSTSLACEFLTGKDAPLCVCILCALNSVWYKVDAYLQHVYETTCSTYSTKQLLSSWSTQMTAR